MRAREGARIPATRFRFGRPTCCATSAAGPAGPGVADELPSVQHRAQRGYRLSMPKAGVWATPLRRLRSGAILSGLASVRDERIFCDLVGAMLLRQSSDEGGNADCEGEAHWSLAPAEAAYGGRLASPVGD
jgi:hypothetical protein